MTPAERVLFDQLRNEYKGKNVSFSYLSLDSLVANSDMKIPVLQDDSDAAQTPRNATERRLQRNHLFVGTRLALYLKKVASGVHGNAQLFTYPNRTVFADNLTTFLNADLYGIYSGSLTMKQQNEQYEPAVEALRFLHAPAAEQFGQTSTTDETTAVVSTIGKRFDPFTAEFGEVYLQSFIELNGINEHEILLKVPGASSLKMAHTASNTQNFVNLRIRGFLIENVNSQKGN